jgi:hypothetical protein
MKETHINCTEISLIWLHRTGALAANTENLKENILQMVLDAHRTHIE